jgi:UDP-glucose 4-epimerase
MKILFTGASSFTGFWFVMTLSAVHEVVCPITREMTGYTGIRQKRLELLRPLCRLVPLAPFGSKNFLRLAAGENFDVLCHHAADVTNYKSSDFDAQAALRNNTCNLPLVLQTLKQQGLKSVVLTGTYFEAGEGGGGNSAGNLTPYSLSKAWTYDLFKWSCRDAGVPLGKFVIPNPFGPLEEPRFTAYLMQNWKAGKVVEVKTPNYLRDNIHVDLLALSYAKFVAQAAESATPLFKINPSGYVESQGAFAQRVAREVKARTGWACELKLFPQTEFNEPANLSNMEPAAEMEPEWNEGASWDAFVQNYVG